MPIFSPVILGNRLPQNLPEPQKVDNNSWVAVSALNNFTTGIQSNNLLFAWGTNNVFQVGDGTTTNKSLPVQISTSSFSQVSAGFDHSAALTTTNRLFVWGNQPSTAVLTDFQSWTSIATGGDHFIGLRANGTVWLWGRNAEGQIGDNTTLNRSSPVQLGSASNYTQISAGYYNSAAITNTGQLFIWGLGSAGQMGNLVVVSRSSPIQIPARSGRSWIQVSAGNQYYLAIDSTNSLFTWGLNNLYQLGLNDQLDAGWRSSPVQIGTSSWTSVSAGGLGDHSVGIDVLGNLYVWGNFNSAFAPIPTTIYSWTQLSAGGQHTSALRSDGTVWTWGNNAVGQLGQPNTTIARSSPVQVTSSSFTQVSSKYSNSAAIRADGTLLVWGLNNAGQLGNNSTLNRSSPVTLVSPFSATSWASVTTGTSNTAAIRSSDSSIYIWGDSTAGQLGNSEVVSKSSPVQLGSGGNPIDTSTYINTVTSVGTTNTIVEIPNLSANPVSLYFNGGPYIETTTGVNLGAGGSTFTCEFWVKFDDLSTERGLVAFNIPTPIGSSGQGIIFRRLSNNGLSIKAGGGIGGQVDSAGNIFTSTSIWYHIAFVKVSTVVNVYVNGTIVISNGAIDGWSLAEYPLWIGANFSGGGNWSFTTGFLLGYISNLRIVSGVAVYTGAFTPPTSVLTTSQSAGTNISAITASQTRLLLATNLASINITSYNFIDTSSYAYSLTRNTVIYSGTTPTLTGTPISYYFDGTNYVSSALAANPVNFGATNVGFTAEAWVKFNDLGTTAGIFGLNISGGNGAWIYRNTSNGFTVWSITSPGNTTQTSSASNLITSTSVWYHIAWVRRTGASANLTDVFLDGTQIITAGTIVNPFTTAAVFNLYIGANFFATNPSGFFVDTTGLNGYISNARIVYNVQVYTGAFTVPTSTLTATQSSGTNISAITTGQTYLLTAVNLSSVVSTGAQSWSQVDAGDRFFVAKRSDGTLWAWGLGTSGQMGISTITSRSSPIQTASGSWLTLSTGLDHVLAIRSDNTLWTWGNFNAIGLVTEVQSWTTISAGAQNTLAIKSDNTLWAWGANAQGQVGDLTVTLKNSPVNIAGSGWTSVFAGNSASFATNNNNLLYAWGFNSSGQLGDGTSINKSSPVQIGASSWTLISNGVDQTLGIDAVGRLFGWGNNTFGQNGIADVNPSYVAIAGGLALRADGTLWSWGSNPGDGTTIFRSSPVQIGTNEWASIAPIYQSTFAKAAIKTDRTLWMWGDNSNGQLGQNDTINRSSPVQVTGSWNQVSTQLSNTAALNSSNILFTWGNNSSGQLGDNTTINKSSPVLLASPFNASSWTLVSVGYSHMAALRTDSIMYTWGRNNIGQLGNSQPGVNRSNPVLLASPFNTTSWTTVSSGASHLIAIRTTDRAAFGWGAPWGNGTPPSGNNISNPVQIGTNSWSQVATHSDSSYGITTTGALWVWGTNNNGLIAQNINFANFNAASVPIQIGAATNYTRVGPASTITSNYAGLVWGPDNVGLVTTVFSSPVQVGARVTAQNYSPAQVGSSSWTTVEAASSFSVAIDLNNLLYGWGLNTSGQLGQNDTINRSSPIQLNASSWLAVAAEFDHVLAIRSDTTLWTWGNSTAIGLVTLPQSWSQVSTGFSHTLAIRSDGSLFAWGLNSSGQLGLGNAVDRNSPTLVSSSSWSQVSAGNNFSLAIDSNNRLYGWGLNTSFQTGDNFNVSKSLPTQIGYTIQDQSTFNNQIRAYGQNIERTIVPFANSVSAFCAPGLTWGMEMPYNANMAVWYDADYTMECWIYPLVLAVSPSNSTPLVLSHGLAWSTSTYWAFGVNTNGNVYFYYFNGGAVTVAQGGSCNINNWHHIAMTHTNSTGIIRLYHNGVLVATAAKVGTPQADNRFEVNIGAVQGTTFNGYVSNVRIVKGVVVYTGEFFPPTTNLTATQSAGYNISAITSGQTSLLVLTSPATILGNSWVTVSAGDTHALATRTDGSLWSWGVNNVGQAGRLNTAQSFTLITTNSSSFNSNGIRNDGILFIWGDNDQGQIGTGDILARSSPVQIGTSSWTSISTGRFHTLAIRNDGTLWAWGLGTSGQLGVNNTTNTGSPVQVTSISESWTVVSAGVTHSVGITETGKLYAWGNNTNGILGINSTINRSTPVQITTIAGSWSAVTAGYSHTAGITTTGTAYAWGLNTSGQLGNNTIINRSNPTLLATPFDVSSWTIVSAGLDFTMARLTNGLAYGWGINSNGQLGNNTSINRSNATLVSTVGLISWTTISAGGVFATAIATDSTLWAWGQNNLGQLGNGETIDRSRPTQVRSLTVTDGGTNLLPMAATSTLAVTTSIIPFANTVSALFSGIDTLNTAATSGNFIFGTGDFTIELWVYLRSVSANQNIYDQRPAGSNGPFPTIYFRLATVSITYFVNVVDAINSSTVSVNTWYHVAVVKSSTSTRMYINGTQAGSTYTDPNNYNNGANRPLLGADATNPATVFLSGYVSNVRVVRGVAVYTGNFTVPTSPLTATQSAGVNISAITAGQTSLLLLTDTNSVTLGNSWSQVGAGQSHVVARQSDGTLWAWGANASGQMGYNDAINRSSPVLVGNIPDMNRWSPVQVASSSWSQVDAGISFSSGIDSAGQLYGWGWNNNRQVGDTTTVNKFSPVVIASGSWTKVSSGASHSLAIRSDGALFGWGAGPSLNINNVTPFSWSQVSNGGRGSFTAAIRSDGSLWTWGLGTIGQLGVSDVISRSSPVLVSTSSWTSVNVGTEFVAAIRLGGNIFVWGRNSDGQLGFNDVISRSSPTQLDTNSWSSISASEFNLAAIRNNFLYVWGRNDQGQLGDGTTISKSSPVQIAGSWNSVSSAYFYTLAINSRNNLFGWGLNTSFQLGNNTTINRSSPVLITASASFTSVVGGEFNSAAIDTNNKLWLWGRDLNILIDPNSWTQVAYTDSSAMAIRSDGRLFAWGLNSSGQLGSNDAINRSSPVLVGPAQSSVSWSQISVQTSNAYAIDSIGNLYGWGQNNLGSVGDNTTINRSNPTVLFSGGTKFLGLQQAAFIDTVGINTISTAGGTIPTITRDIGSYAGYAVSFTGNGYLQVPLSGLDLFSIPASTNWTFECWIYLNSIPTGTTGAVQNQFVIASRNWNYGVTATSTWAFSVQQNASVSWRYGFTGTASGILAETPALSISTGAWTHLAFVKTSANLVRIYINGSLSTSTTDINPMSSTTGDLFIGIASNLSAASFFNGFISDLRIVSGVAVYTGIGFTVPSRPLATTQSSGANISAITGAGITAVASGFQFGMALTNTGILYMWGQNTAGQLGNNSTINRSSPIIITANGGGSFVSIAGGNSFATAVDSNGRLYAWGLNSGFQLGNTNAINRSMPVQIAPNVSWATVSAGWSHAGARDTSGRLYLWGPGAVTNLSTETFSWTQISVGEGSVAHVLAIRSDGLLYAWGSNAVGQLGDNSAVNRSSPTLVAGVFGIPGSWYGSWTNVTAGGSHSVARNSDGRIYTWGLNSSGQLGLNDTINRSNPTLVSSLTAPTNFVEQISQSTATVNAFVSFVTDNTLYPGAIALSTVSTPNSGFASTPANANLLMTGDFTIEMWFRSTNNGAVNDSLRLTGTTGWRFRTTIASPAQLEFIGSGGVPTLSIASIIAVNTWYHIAVTRSGSNMNLWVNGSVQSIAIYSGNVGDATNPLIYASGDGGGAAGANQNLNNVRIINGTALYTTALFPTGMVPYRGPFTPLFGSQTVVLALTTGNTLIAPATNTLSAGELHTALTFSDGRLFTFGSNNTGQLGDGTTINRSSPVLVGSIANSWTTVSSGLSYTIALRNNNSMWSWGQNTLYQLGDGTTLAKSSPVLISGTTSFTQLSIGANHALAISSNLNLWTWGDVNSVILTNTESPTSWTQIAPGSAHTLGIRSDGILFAWGSNTSGQLGDGTTVTKSSPVVIGNSRYTFIGAATNNSFAVRTDGTLWAWGGNTTGILGDNTTITKSSPVQVVAAGVSFVSVAGGNFHAAGIDTLGRIYAWGSGGLGQTGFNNTINRSTPLQLGTNSWISVSAGISHTVAIRNDYTLWGWGQNSVNQLGDSTSINRSSPVQVDANKKIATSWTQISSFFDHNLAVDQNFGLYTWGNSTAISLIIQPQSWAQLSAGGSHTLAIRSDGFLYAWGAGTGGQLGTNDAVNRSSPVLVGGTNSWNAVAAGSNFSLAIRSDGSLWSWGSNTSNQLGDGTSINKSSPVNIAAGNIFTKIAAGGAHGLALRDNLSVWSWGLNNVGQLGTGTTVNRTTPASFTIVANGDQVYAGASFAAIINTNLNLYTFGLNSSGQLGLGNTINRSIPTQVTTGFFGNLVQLVSLGFDHVLGKEVGSGLIFGWGNNNRGQLGINNTINRSAPVQIGSGSWVTVSAGQNWSMGLLGISGFTSNGIPYAWGLNDSNQLGDGTSINRSNPVLVTGAGTSSYTQISAGWIHGAAVQNTGLMYAWGLGNNGAIGDNLATATRSVPTLVGAPNSLNTGFNIPNRYRFPAQVAGSSYVSVSAGQSTSVVTDELGMVYAWGLGTSGQLGDNTVISKSFPVVLFPQTFTVLDVSSYAYTLTRTGTTYTTNTFPVTGAVSGYFNGNGDNIAMPVAANITALSGEYTVEAWFYLASFAPADGYQHLLLGTTFSFGIFNQRIWLTNNAVGLLNDPNPVVINTWYHYALVNSAAGNYCRIFRDGVQVASGISRDFSGSTGISRIGSNNSNGQFWFGLISNMRVVKGVAVYTGNFTVPTTVLTATQSAGTNISAITAGQTALLTYTTLGASLSNISTPFTTKAQTAGSSSFGYNSSGLYVWGLNTSGQLGNNTAVNRSSPTLVTNSGLYTQLGIPTIINNVLSWSTVSAGASHSIAKTTNEQVFAWGLNTSGQLGDNTAITKSSPVLINASSPVLLSSTVISAGRDLSFMINSANLLFAWGLNTTGQLGIYDALSRSRPVQLNLAQQLDTGTTIPTLVQRNNIFLNDLSTSNLRLTFDNDAVPISFGPFTPSSSVQLNLNKTLGQINRADGIILPATSNFNVGSFTDYTIEGWIHLVATPAGTGAIFYTMANIGQQAWSRLYVTTTSLVFEYGSGTWAWTTSISGTITGYILNTWYHAAMVKSGSTVSLYWNGSRVATNASFVITPGYGGSLYIGSNGRDWDNNGTYTRGYISNFRMLAGTALYSGTSYTIPTGNFTAITNTVFLLGSTSFTPTVPSYTQVGLGISYTMALRNDNTLWTWGLNNNGQLGDATSINKSSPVQVAFGNAQWLTIAAGLSTNAAIATGQGTRNKLFLWGMNSGNQMLFNDVVNRSSPTLVYASTPTQIPSPFLHDTSWTNVSIGLSFSIARRSDTALMGWGLNTSGQFGDNSLVNSSRSNPVFVGVNTYLDESSNGVLPSSVQGAPKFVDFSPFATNPYDTTTLGGSMQFNLVDWIQYPWNTRYDIGTNSASMEVWAYWNTFRTSISYMTLFGQNSGAFATIKIWSNLFGSDASVRYSVNDDTVRGETAIVTNTWYHLVVTITGGVVRFFVNGVLRDYVTGINYVINRQEAFIFGNEDSGYFNGYLSNFRFCNGSIPTSYQTVSSTIGATIFTPPTSPVTTTSQGATSGDVVLLCFRGITPTTNNWISANGGTTTFITSNNLLNKTGLGTTGQIADGAALTRSNPIVVGNPDRFFAPNTGILSPVLVTSGSWTNISAGNSTSSALRSDNTLWVWGLNTNGQTGDYTSTTRSPPLAIQVFNVTDSSSSNQTIYNTGLGYTTAVIPFAGAVSGQFSYFNTYLQLTSPSNLAFGSSNFTIELWLYPTSIVGNNQSTYVVLDWRPFSTQGLFPTLYGNNVGFYYFTNSGNLIAGPALNLNTWYHVAVQRQNSITRMFINGLLVGTPAADTNVYTIGTGTVNRPALGTSGFSLNDASFIGYISNFRVVNGTTAYNPGFTVPTTSLTTLANTLETNVTLLTCQSATIIDNSVYRNVTPLTVNGATTVQTLSPFTPTTFSVQFTGAGSYINTPLSLSQLNVGDFSVYSIECWFYPTSIASATTKTIIAAWNSGVGGPFSLSLNASNVLLVRTGTNASPNPVTGTTVILPNQWYHVALHKVSTTVLTLYINGLVEILTSYTWGSGYSPARQVTIGAEETGTNPFIGHVSNVRLVRNQLPYIASFPVPTSPLAATQSSGTFTNAVTAAQTALLTLNTPSNITGFSYTQTSAKNTIHGVDNTNALYGTGTNNVGQIGIASNINRSNFVQVGASGQTLNTYTTSPVQVTPGTSGYAQVWAGQSFSAARRSNGDIFVWGLNTSSQLGLGDAITRSSPVLMTNYQSFNQVLSVGYSHWAQVRVTDWIPLDVSTFATTVTKVGTGIRYNTSVTPFATAVSMLQTVNNPALTINAQTPLSFGTGDFTVEAWVYPLSINAVYSGIFDARAGAVATAWAFGLRTTSGTARVDFFTGGALTGSRSVLNSVWTHIAATRSGTTISLWVNGVLDTAFTSQSTALNAQTTLQYVGRLIDTIGYSFDGYLSNLRIVKGVAVYTGTFTVPTSPLAATQSSGTNISAITGTQTSLLLFTTEAASISWVANNKMYTQGGDGSGQLGQAGGGNRNSFVLVGNGTHINSGTLSPIQVGFGLPNSWTSVSAGTSYSYARNSLGQTYAWGLNSNAVLGFSDTIARSSPTLLGATSVLLDGSQYNNTITNNGGVSYVTNIVPFAGAVSGLFTGSNSLSVSTNVNNNLNTPSGTIEFWYYPLSYGGTIINNINTDGGLSAYFIGWSGSNLVFNISPSSGGSYNGFTVATTASFPLNTWTYFQITVQSNNSWFAGTNGAYGGLGGTGSRGYNGGTITVGNGINGYISNLRISNTALYTGSFTISTVPLTTSGGGGGNINAFTSSNIGLLLLASTTNVTGAVNYNLVSTGQSHVAVTYPNNTLYTLGLNSSGQIGDNTTVNRQSPVLIGNIFNTNTISPVLAASASWTAASAGTSYSLAINSNGTLWAWGLNSSGQLGTSDAVIRSSIVQIGTSSYTSVRAGHSTTVAIDVANRLFAWGLGTSGQVGNMTVITRSSPVFVGTSYSVITTGNITGGAINQVGMLYIWGGGTVGQFANSLAASFNRSSPTLVQGINYETKSPTILAGSWNSVSAGFSHTAARSETTLYVWGRNTEGQLGTNDALARSSPTVVGIEGLTITDASTNNYTVTNFGTVRVQNAFNLYTSSSSVFLPGNLNYLQLSYVPANFDWWSSNYTVEFWVYPTSFTGANTIIGNMTPTAGTIYWGLGLNTIGQIAFYYFNGAGNTITGTTQVGLFQWTHLALVVNGSNILLFTNGLLQSTTAIVGTPQSLNTVPLIIGGYTSTNFLNGFVSNIRIVKGTAIYTANFTPPASPLTAVANTQLLLLAASPSVGYQTVYAGTAATFAIRTNGPMFATGSNTGGEISGFMETVTKSNYSQIGNNYISVNPSSPVQIAAGSWSKVSAGNSVSAAIRSDGLLFTWGSFGTGGAIGDGTTIAKSSPVQIGNSSWTQVSVYDTHMIGLGPIGQLYTWGLNANGQLGLTNINASGDTINRSSPVLVGAALTVLDTSGNGITITANATSFTTSIVPIIGAVSGVFAGNSLNRLATASSTVFLLGTSDFTIELWFYTNSRAASSFPILITNGNFGAGKWQLNDRHNNYPTKLTFGVRSIQVDVNFLISTTTIVNNTWYHVAVVRSGSNWTMFVNGIAESTNTSAAAVGDVGAQAIYVGGDATGQTGTPYNGNISNVRIVKGVAVYTGNFTVPTSVLTATQSAGTNISAITAGQTSLLTYTTQGASISGGSPTYFSSISAGSSFTGGVTTAGALFMWGLGTSGQLGYGTAVSRSSPVQVGTSSWTSVVAGNNNSAGIRSNNTLFNWGSSNQGQLGTFWFWGVQLSSPVQLGNQYAAAGTTTRIPVKVGNILWKSVNAGNSFTTAITSNDRLFAWGINNAGQLGQNDTINRSEPSQIGVNTYLSSSTGTSNTGAIGKAT